mmetsp:Transcript_13777/g.18844  ORF Transcript_13777/g.18844 Transcript_13777/m.18844 type:complete len:214 (-) Transcript_13777:202-843(-)
MEGDRFYRYEENFLNCSRIISRCLAQLEAARGDVDKVIASSVEIEGELSEAEGYLRAMDIEFRTMSSAEKRSAQQKVGDYKEEYKQLQQHFHTSKFNAESEALKNSPTARVKLLTSNQKLDQATATLEQSRMLIAQTETIGDTIITDMGTQKETLMDAREKVKETKGFTVDAKRILRMMSNRAVMHKIFVIFTIVVLFAGICAITYYGFIVKK